MVEQRVALARGAVADDALAVGARPSSRNVEQVALDREDVARRTRRDPRRVCSPAACLGGEHGADALGRLAGGGRVAGVHPQRAAVRGQLLDVDHAQAGGGERPRRREQREVLVVLVVDRVVLAALDQPQQVRELERDQPVRLDQQRRQPGGEADEVGDVGVHVVAGHQVGAAVLGGERRRRSPAPRKCTSVRMPFATRDLGDVGRRLDAEHRDARGDEVLQQVAVVARHLGHQAVRPEAELVDHRVGVAAGVLDPGVRVRREVGVVGEDVLAGHVGRAAAPAGTRCRCARAAGRTTHGRRAGRPAGSSRTAATCRGRRTSRSGRRRTGGMGRVVVLVTVTPDGRRGAFRPRASLTNPRPAGSVVDRPAGVCRLST